MKNTNTRVLIACLQSLLLTVKSGGMITATDLIELTNLLPSKDMSARGFFEGELALREDYERDIATLAAAGNPGARQALGMINKEFRPGELEAMARKKRA